MKQEKEPHDVIIYILAIILLLAILIVSSSCKKSMSVTSTPPPIQDTDVNNTVNGDTAWETGGSNYAMYSVGDYLQYPVLNRFENRS